MGKKTLFFIFWAGFLLGIYLYNKPQTETFLKFEINVHSSDVDNPSGVFYYNTGEGFNEKQKWIVSYDKAWYNDFRRYSLKLPANKIYQLRFDPLPSGGEVSIRNLVVDKYYPKPQEFINVKTMFASAHAIDSINSIENGIRINCGTTDPYLVLIDDIREFSVFDYQLIHEYIGIDKILAGVLALVLLSYLISSFSFTGRDIECKNDD